MHYLLRQRVNNADLVLAQSIPRPSNPSKLGLPFRSNKCMDSVCRSYVRNGLRLEYERPRGAPFGGSTININSSKQSETQE